MITLSLLSDIVFLSFNMGKRELAETFWWEKNMHTIRHLNRNSHAINHSPIISTWSGLQGMFDQNNKVTKNEPRAVRK